MKTFQKLTLLMSMIVLLSAIPMMAQIGDGMTFQAPSAFYAGNAKLPPGSYRVTRPDDNSELLLIESVDGLHSVLIEYVPDDSPTAPSQTEITFNKYGDTDFLSSVSVQGEGSVQILASKAEHNAAKNAALEKHSLSAKNGR
jgi:hypothetical protein